MASKIDGAAVTPGYFDKFISIHSRKGENFAEFVKCFKQFNYCDGRPWASPVTQRIPQPMPDQSSGTSYLHVNDTPSTINNQPRMIDDFNPRVSVSEKSH